MKATATALIVIALVAVACGGEDSSSPAPGGQPTGAAATSGADSASPAIGAGESVEYTKTAKHSSADDPEATYALTSGRYRFAWDSPSENPCSRVEVAVTQVDGDFRYAKASTTARFNTTVNDLPQGIYKLEQLDPACTEWDLRIDWMAN